MSHFDPPAFNPSDLPDPLRNESPPTFTPYFAESPLDFLDRFRRHLLYVDPAAEVTEYLSAIPAARCLHIVPSNEQSYHYVNSISPPLKISVIRPDKWLKGPDI